MSHTHNHEGDAVSATLLLQIVERAHRYMDAHGYPKRACPPSFATAQLMKEPTVSVVTDLFDKPDRPRAECGTLGGAKRHYREGTPTCAACRKAWAEYNADRRLDERKAKQQTLLDQREQAKALDAHRLERARLQASLTPEERARLAAS